MADADSPSPQKLARIPHYEAGAESADAAEQSRTTLVMLASNESPFPPVEGVVEAVAAAAGAVNRYPDPDARGAARARSRTATSFPLSRDRGRQRLVRDPARGGRVALLEPWNELVYAWPSFSMYPHLDGITDAKAVRVPLDDGYVHDLDAMLGAITDQTRLLIVCNPNNPTSTYLAERARSRASSSRCRSACS